MTKAFSSDIFVNYVLCAVEPNYIQNIFKTIDSLSVEKHFPIIGSSTNFEVAN